MKRLILMMILAALLIPAALADGNMMVTLGESDYLQSVSCDGETVFAAADMKLYVWRPGNDAAQTYAGELTVEGPDGDATTVYLYELRWYADGDGLHAVRMAYDDDYVPEALQVFDLTLSDGALSGALARTLDLPGGFDEDIYIHAVCSAGGRLYLIDSGRDGDAVSVIDLQTGRSSGPNRVSNYGASLACSRAGAFVSYTDYDRGACVLCRIADDAGLDELCALPMDARAVAVDDAGEKAYCVTGGRAYGADIRTGELGEAIAALPASPEYGALADGGRMYVVNVGAKIAAIPTDGRLNADAVLNIQGYGPNWVNTAAMDYAVSHPQLTPVVGYGDFNAVDELLSQSPDTDIYMLSSAQGAYESVLERGFMLPLDQSEPLKAFSARVYPNLMTKLTRGGALVALPVSLYGNGMGMSRALLERLGFPLESVPRDWPGFLDFMENELKPKLDQLGEKDKFTYDGMNARDFGYFMKQRALNDFMQASDAAGTLSNYEDPRLLDTLERLDAIDFTDYGLPEKLDEDGGYGYGWSSDTHYLIQFDADYLLENRMADCVPVPLGFGDDLPGVLSVEMVAAFVNPYSKHADEAVAFLEALAGQMPDQLLYALCPDLNEPVHDPSADEWIANVTQEIERLQAGLETAESANRQMLEEQLSMMQAELERFREEESWLISPEKLAMYRANADKLAVAAPSWFQKDTTGEGWQLMQQYFDGQITAREFLSAVNRKARMMAMEEG